MISCPGAAAAPPERPVRPPWVTTGMPPRWQSASSSLTCDVVSGSAIRSAERFSG